MKRIKSVWLPVLLCLLCLVCLLPAAAAKTGTLRLFVEDEPGLRVQLYPVADPSGRLNSDFSGAGLSAKDVLDARLSDENAALLARYAKEHNLTPKSKTTDADGNVVFDALSEGCYLVLTPGEDPCFDPFMVFVPTMINGRPLYDITAEPKSDDPPSPPPVDPDAPDDPVDPDPGNPVDPVDPDPDTPGDPDEPQPEAPVEPEPEIPQTGVNVWPKLLLLALGAASIALGCVELLRGRKESHE